jgi:hypothetical protein
LPALAVSAERAIVQARRKDAFLYRILDVVAGIVDQDPFDRNRIMDQEGRTEWNPNPDDRLAKTFGGPAFERIRASVSKSVASPSRLSGGIGAGGQYSLWLRIDRACSIPEGLMPCELSHEGPKSSEVISPNSAKCCANFPTIPEKQSSYLSSGPPRNL